MSAACPHCGCSKSSGLTNRWQDGFTCGTVYPFDGPHRRGESCLAIEAVRDERDNLRRLLRLAAEHVDVSAEAHHMLDGFRRQVRPLDALVEEIRAAVTTTTEGAQA